MPNDDENGEQNGKSMRKWWRKWEMAVEMRNGSGNGEWAKWPIDCIKEDDGAAKIQILFV